MVVVKVNGDIKYKESINQSKQLVVDGYQGGSNQIVIQDGYVYMADADCPDKLYVNIWEKSVKQEKILYMYAASRCC